MSDHIITILITVSSLSRFVLGMGGNREDLNNLHVLIASLDSIPFVYSVYVSEYVSEIEKSM